jgi:uncharacterized membrane protein
MGSKQQPQASGARLDSVDLLRGVVMVLMALDHTRDYFTNIHDFDPLDPARTNLALYLTRWVTHFCAPVFVLLAGTGAFLGGCRGKSKNALAWFLLTRGLWLVFLELTFVRFAWTFNFEVLNLSCAVIWAIGWSMVVLAVLVFLPAPAVALLGALLIAGHNLLDGVSPDAFGRLGWLWAFLHVPSLVQPIPGVYCAIPYPLVPWVGVMAVGYGLGPVMLLEPGRRRRWLLIIGTALTLAFVAVRAANGYGEPRAWSLQANGLRTLFSFLNCTKYPPSLDYLLMTLGPAIAALALFDRPPGPVGRFFQTYGRVPLFFYLLHLPLIHGLAVLLDLVRYGWSPYASQAFYGVDLKLLPPGYGFGLPVIYLLWLGVVLALYPACRWFAGVKRRRRDAWLSYL